MTIKDFLKLVENDSVELLYDLPHLPAGTRGKVVQARHDDPNRLSDDSFVEILFDEQPQGKQFHRATYTFGTRNAGHLKHLKKKKKYD